MGVSEEWLEPNIPGVFFICDREIPAEKRVPNKKDTPDTPTQAAWATYDLATWAPSGKQHTTSVFFLRKTLLTTTSTSKKMSESICDNDHSDKGWLVVSIRKSPLEKTIPRGLKSEHLPARLP